MQFQEMDLLPSCDDWFEMCVACFKEIQHNTTLWDKMNVFPNNKCFMGNSPMKHEHTFRSWTSCEKLNLLTWLVLEWEIHESIKLSIIQQYELKQKFLGIKVILS
jgi:hypothetical protein